MAEFWNTMNVMIGKEWRRAEINMEEWVDNIIKKENYVSEDQHKITPSGRIPSFCSSMVTVEITSEDIKEFWDRINLPKITCVFSNFERTSQILRLMDSNYVDLVDREHMQMLQERIMQDYTHKMNCRIKMREGKELERVKTLVLDGKIPINKAPTEMSSHPIMFLESYIAVKERKRRKIRTSKSPSTARSDQPMTPASALATENKEKLELRDSTESNEDMHVIPVIIPAEFENFKNDSPEMKQLRLCETVNEMYLLADEIIGSIKEVEVSTKSAEESSSNS